VPPGGRVFGGCYRFRVRIRLVIISASDSLVSWASNRIASHLGAASSSTSVPASVSQFAVSVSQFPNFAISPFRNFPISQFPSQGSCDAQLFRYNRYKDAAWPKRKQTNRNERRGKESQGREKWVVTGGCQGFCAVLPSHKSLCSFYLFYFPSFFFAHAPRRANAKETLTEASFVNEISRRHKAAKQCDKRGGGGRTIPPHPPCPKSNPSGKSRGERMHREPIHNPPPTTHNPSHTATQKTKANTNNAAKKHSRNSL